MKSEFKTDLMSAVRFALGISGVILLGACGGAENSNTKSSSTATCYMSPGTSASISAADGPTAAQCGWAENGDHSASAQVKADGGLYTSDYTNIGGDESSVEYWTDDNFGTNEEAMTAPVCSGAGTTVDKNGRSWGFENGVSCKAR